MAPEVVDVVLDFEDDHLQVPPLACRAYPSDFSRQQPDVGHDDIDREGEVGRVGGVNKLN